MTIYPDAVKYYRQDLATRRLKRRPLYEIQSPDTVEHDPSSVNRFKDGVYNFGKHHWGVHCDNITYSFVWITECEKDGSGTAVVSGGSCLSYFEVPEGKDIHEIGATGLSIRDIERAGKFHFMEKMLIDREMAVSVCWMSSCSMEISDPIC